MSSRWRRRRRTPARKSRRPMILTEVIYHDVMSLTSMVYSSWLSLPSTMSSSTNTFGLNVVKHVKNINIAKGTTDPGVDCFDQ